MTSVDIYIVINDAGYTILFINCFLFCGLVRLEVGSNQLIIQKLDYPPLCFFMTGLVVVICLIILKKKKKVSNMNNDCLLISVRQYPFLKDISHSCEKLCWFCLSSCDVTFLQMQNSAKGWTPARGTWALSLALLTCVVFQTQDLQTWKVMIKRPG